MSRQMTFLKDGTMLTSIWSSFPNHRQPSSDVIQRFGLQSLSKKQRQAAGVLLEDLASLSEAYDAKPIIEAALEELKNDVRKVNVGIAVSLCNDTASPYYLSPYLLRTSVAYLESEGWVDVIGGTNVKGTKHSTVIVATKKFIEVVKGTPTTLLPCRGKKKSNPLIEISSNDSKKHDIIHADYKGKSYDYINQSRTTARMLNDVLKKTKVRVEERPAYELALQSVPTATGKYIKRIFNGQSSEFIQTLSADARDELSTQLLDFYARVSKIASTRSLFVDGELKAEYKHSTFIFYETTNEKTASSHYKNRKHGGGRMKAGWHSITKEMQKTMTLTFNGQTEGIVSVDFNAMHPRYAYQLANVHVPKDPYTISGIHTSRRKAIKLAFQFLLNAKGGNKNYTIYLTSMKRGKFLNPLTKEEWDLFLQATEELKDIKALWLNAFGFEGEILNAVVQRFIKETNSPILPFHDGFKVWKRYKNTLIQIMKEEYERIAGHSTKLKVEFRTGEESAPRRPEIASEATNAAKRRRSLYENSELVKTKNERDYERRFRCWDDTERLSPKAIPYLRRLERIQGFVGIFSACKETPSFTNAASITSRT